MKWNIKLIPRALSTGPGYDRLDEDMAERLSAMRRPGESELDYYERRYQERVSL